MVRVMAMATGETSGTYSGQRPRLGALRGNDGRRQLQLQLCRQQNVADGVRACREAGCCL